MKHVLFILLSLITFSSFGQYTSNYQTNIVFQNAPLGSITSLAPAAPETVGSYYLYEDYAVADVYLKDSTKLEDLQIRLDVKDNGIEVKYNDAIKLLPVSKVISLTLKRNGGIQVFVNGAIVGPIAKLYRDQLIRVVVEGESALFCSTKAQIKEAQRSQNPMLGSNREDNEIVHNNVYLIVKGQDFVTTASGKSTFRKELVALYGPEVEPVVKKVNPRNEAELVVLVNALNRPKS